MERPNVIKRMIDCLRDAGFDADMPTYKYGECVEKYVIVKHSGVSDILGISSERPLYTVLCYVPKNRYSELEGFIADVKEVLKELYPMIMYAGNETPAVYDETVKGHVISFMYQGIRRIKRMKGV